MSELQIRTVPIDALIPYARNARTHSDEQIATLAGIIREFGFNVPVLVDADQGIIAGHGRVLAARKLGHKTVPVIELAHLSEAQKRAFILAENKIGEKAGWDEEMLKIELSDLKAAGFDLALTAFDASELKAFVFAEDEDAPPDDFTAYDEDIAVEHVCPNCGYRFSGGETVPITDADDDDA